MSDELNHASSEPLMPSDPVDRRAAATDSLGRARSVEAKGVSDGEAIALYLSRAGVEALLHIGDQLAQLNDQLAHLSVYERDVQALRVQRWEP